jgi:hypothetical protein
VGDRHLNFHEDRDPLWGTTMTAWLVFRARLDVGMAVVAGAERPRSQGGERCPEKPG